jgi:putative hemolysin
MRPTRRRRPRAGRLRALRAARELTATTSTEVSRVRANRPVPAQRRRSGAVPKVTQAGPVARAVARVVVSAADAATRWVTRLLGASATAGRHAITEAELRELVAGNVVLDGEERRIIHEVLAAGARHVREVMVPRTDVLFLDATATVAEAVQTVRDTPHSRFPVINGSYDDVVGFVHLRDLLLPAALDLTVADLAREVRQLPGSRRILAALSEMRRERHHLALVVDEYGGTAGIVTLEDLIEELVGEIHDEYDAAPDPEPPPGVPPAGLDGRINLGDFAERCGFALPSGPYETVGGFVMARLGRVASAGDEVRVGAWRIVVTECDGRRVSRVSILPA